MAKKEELTEDMEFVKFKIDYREECEKYRKYFVDGLMSILQYTHLCSAPLVSFIESNSQLTKSQVEELDVLLCEFVFPPVRSRI